MKMRFKTLFSESEDKPETPFIIPCTGLVKMYSVKHMLCTSHRSFQAEKAQRLANTFLWRRHLLKLNIHWIDRPTIWGRYVVPLKCKIYWDNVKSKLYLQRDVGDLLSINRLGINVSGQPDVHCQVFCFSSCSYSVRMKGLTMKCCSQWK